VDVLTGLHNRRGFLMLAESSPDRPRPVADLLLFIDLDGMKRINDLGHEAGDAALRERPCSTPFRPDTIARLGGQFVVSARTPGRRRPPRSWRVSSSTSGTPTPGPP
jgi:diguanylate cyclase (GGDEF)-like protein